MKMYGKDGMELMDIQSFQRQGDVLVMKGKMMGAMAANVQMRPEDLWGAFKLMPWSILLRLPLMLYKGWRAQRRAGKAVKVGA